MSADKPVQQAPVQKHRLAAPASAGSGIGAESALAEMIRKRTVHIEPEQLLQSQPPPAAGPGGKTS